MRARLAVLLGSLLSPRRVERLTGRVPLRQASLADVGARDLAFAHGPGRPSTGRVIEARDVVLGATGIVVDQAFRVVREACSLSPRTDAPWQDARNVGLLPVAWQPARDCADVPGTTASLVASTQGFYFHWIFDVLPRVALVRAAGAEPDAWYADVSRAFQRETLAAVGVDAARVVDAARLPAVRAERAVLPLHRVEDGQPFPSWVVDLLRRTFPAPSAALDGPELIWVSRRGAMTRRLLNEDEILDRLRPLGLVEVQPETLPVAEQARLFGGARLVVAPHGSGLANLVFVAPGTQLVELMPTRAIDVFARLASAVRCAYSSVAAEDAGGRPSAYDDFRVPPDAVLRAVEAALRETPTRSSGDAHG